MGDLVLTAVLHNLQMSSVLFRWRLWRRFRHVTEITFYLDFLQLHSN